MRQPAFVYEIVPELGEYGFTRKPDAGDRKLEPRVRSLVASFQWRSDAGPADAVAIAIDADDPVAVARISRDNRDPHGRVSLRLEAWLAENWDAACQIADEIWANAETRMNGAEFPVSRQSFLQQAEIVKDRRQGERRIVIGPEGSFSAVQFATSIGAAHSRREESSRQVPQRAIRAAKSPTGVSYAVWCAAIASLACLFAIAACFRLSQRLADAQRQAAEMAVQAQELALSVQNLEETQRGLRDEATALDAQARSTAREIDRWRQVSGSGSPDELRGRIASLEESAKQDPERIDRQRLEELIRLESRVQKFVQSLRTVLGEFSLESSQDQSTQDQSREPQSIESQSSGASLPPVLESR